MLFQEIEAPVGLIVAMESFVWLFSLIGQEEKAAKLHGAAAAMRESTIVPTSLEEEAAYAEYLLRLRTVLGAERFAACEKQGREQSLEDVIASTLPDQKKK
jgi:hypothetical protein